MCITVTNTKPEPTGIGWKVFDKPGRFLDGEYSTWCRRPMKKWLHENRYRDINSSRVHPLKYEPGWHIFKNLSDAQHWGSVPIQVSDNLTIRRVRYRKAFLQGRNSWKYPIVVAKEILIIPGEVI